MSQFADLNREEAAQLDNLVDLLIDLSIVGSSKQVSEISFKQEELDKNDFHMKNQNHSQKLLSPSRMSNLDNLSSVEIHNQREFLTEENTLTDVDVDVDVDNQCPRTIYLKANLDSPQAQANLPNYQEELFEEITVQTEPLKRKLDNSDDLDDSSQSNTDHYEETNDAFQKLQDILVGDELAEIQENLQKLNHQLYDSDELLKLLLPHITKLLKQKISESQEEFIEAITPIIDKAIYSGVQQNKSSMGEALAGALPVAIAEQISINSEEVAEAMAPAMGEAIQKQIELEQDKIVDALYPVIGNTIAKYMGETIQAINAQIENTLSVEGVKRKIRA